MKSNETKANRWNRQRWNISHESDYWKRFRWGCLMNGTNKWYNHKCCWPGMISESMQELEWGWMKEAGSLKSVGALLLPLSLHAHAHRNRRTKMKEIVLASIKMSHLLKLVPRHLLLLRHIEEKRGRRGRNILASSHLCHSLRWCCSCP